MSFVHVLADVDVLGVFPPLPELRWQNDASRLAMPRDLSRWWRTSCTCTAPGRSGRLALIQELREKSLDLDVIGQLGFVDRIDGFLIAACSGSARKSAHLQDVQGEAIAVGDIRAKPTANLHDAGFRNIVEGVPRCNLDERLGLANRVHDEQVVHLEPSTCSDAQPQWRAPCDMASFPLRRRQHGEPVDHVHRL